MKTYFLNLLKILIIFSTISSNCQTFVPAYGSIVNQCSSANILNNLTYYESLGVKYRGTAALNNTFNWIKNQYLSYGYTVSQIQEDSFSYSGSTCKNLVVTKIGTLYPTTFVIIDGHYDSITGKGTNDNGSGTVDVLEVARLLQNVSTQYSIKFIHFAGEEDGLYGSQHYVNSIVNATNPKLDIRLVFNIDEVGGVAGLTNDTITCEQDQSNPTSNNAASANFTNQLINCVGLYSPLNTNLSFAYSSDYVPFENNNEIITGFFETNESTHRHTTTDLLVNMDPNYVFNVTKASVGAMLHFAKASVTLTTENFSNDFEVTFFPNPTKDILNINIGNLIENNYTISLVDIFGKKIFSKNISAAKQLEQINVTGFAKGVYLAVIETQNNRITKKIVID